MKKIEREKLIDIVLSTRELKQSEQEYSFYKKTRGEKNEYLWKVTNSKN